MILTFTPNPCVDKTIFLDRAELGTFMRSTRCTTIAGGKGVNVSRAAHAMGKPTRAMVVIGGFTGMHVVDMIAREDGIPCEAIEVTSPTRTITTILEMEQHRQTAFFEPGSCVTEEEYKAIVAAYRSTVTSARIATFNGTVSDPNIRRLYTDLIPIAHDAGAITILDGHGPEFAAGIARAPYMIKPNLHEAEELFGKPLNTDDARWEAIHALHAKGIRLVVLSLGKDGALVSRGGERFHALPPAIKEENPVGSGDALVAGFAIGLIEDWSLEAMTRLGVAMGAANAMTWEIARFATKEIDRLAQQVEIKIA